MRKLTILFLWAISTSLLVLNVSISNELRQRLCKQSKGQLLSPNTCEIRCLVTDYFLRKWEDTVPVWSPPPRVPCGSHNLMNFSWVLLLLLFPLASRERICCSAVLGSPFFFFHLSPAAGRGWDWACRKPLLIAHPNTTIRSSSTRAKQPILLLQESTVKKWGKEFAQTYIKEKVTQIFDRRVEDQVLVQKQVLRVPNITSILFFFNRDFHLRPSMH